MNCNNLNPVASFALVVAVLGIRSVLGTWIVWRKPSWLIGVDAKASLIARLVFTELFDAPAAPLDLPFEKAALIANWVTFLAMSVGLVIVAYQCRVTV